MVLLGDTCDRTSVSHDVPFCLSTTGSRSKPSVLRARSPESGYDDEILGHDGIDVGIRQIDANVAEDLS